MQTHVSESPGPVFSPLGIWKNCFIKLCGFSFLFPDWERTHFIWRTFSRPCNSLERLSEANFLSTLKGESHCECIRRVLLLSPTPPNLSSHALNDTGIRFQKKANCVFDLNHQLLFNDALQTTAGKLNHTWCPCTLI